MLLRPAPSTIVGETLIETLLGSRERGHGRFVFHLEQGEVELGWDELVARSRGLAAALIQRGVGHGDRLGVLGRNRPEWVVSAYATWLLGAVLVPLPVPMRIRDGDSFEQQVASFADAASCRAVLAAPEYEQAVPPGLFLPWHLSSDEPVDPPSVGPDDLAVLQFTSGSTAAPTGTMITHRAAIAQLEAVDRVRAVPPETCIELSWAPFFHDMGLFLCLAAAVAQGTTKQVLPTERFARSPAQWFALASSLGAHHLIGPCSAWLAAARLAGRREFDLSSVRRGLFGAEGVDPIAVDEILERLVPHGLDPLALGSTYGLAEAVLGVTCSHANVGLRFDRVDPHALASGLATPAADGRRIASAGHAIYRTEVRVAKDGEALPDRTVGEIQARGVSMMSGYAGTDRAQPFEDGWLKTGDLGYLVEGELFVTGRMKDVIVAMGNNYYPTDVEWVTSRIEGVKRSVAFGVGADGGREDRLVVLVEAGASEVDLPLRVKREVARSVGLAPDDVLVLQKGTIQYTTSGKLKRAAMRAAYLAGDLAPQGGENGN